MPKKLGVTDFVSEIKRVENYPDFEKLAHVIPHGLQGFRVKRSKVSQRRQTTLVIFCRSGPVCYINNFNVANVFAKLNPLRGI